MPGGERLVSVLSLSTRKGHVYRDSDSDSDDGDQVRRRAAAIRGELYVLTRGYSVQAIVSRRAI